MVLTVCPSVLPPEDPLPDDLLPDPIRLNSSATGSAFLLLIKSLKTRFNSSSVKSADPESLGISRFL